MSRPWALYIVIICVLAFTVLYLPYLGSILRGTHSRLAIFFHNLYLAQQSGAQMRQLKEENAALAKKVVDYADLEKENELLRQQLDVKKDKKSFPSLLASIIGQGSSFGKETLVIDKGLANSLKGDEAIVISPNILIGKISNAYEHYAIISLVFNSTFSLPGVTASGTKGVVKGDVGHQALFDEISQASPLVNGDIVVTTNQSPSLPAGILIGKVEKIISKPTDIFKKARISVFFDQDAIQKVFILKLTAPLP